MGGEGGSGHAVRARGLAPEWTLPAGSFVDATPRIEVTPPGDGSVAGVRNERFVTRTRTDEGFAPVFR